MTHGLDTPPDPRAASIHDRLAAIVDRALWRGAGVSPEDRAAVLASEQARGDPAELSRKSHGVLIGWIAASIVALLVMAIPAAVAASTYRPALPVIGALTFASGMFCATGAAAAARWDWAARQASKLYAAGQTGTPAYLAAVRKARPTGKTVPVQVAVAVLSGVLFLL